MNKRARLALLLLIALVIIPGCAKPVPRIKPVYFTMNNVKLVSRVEGDRITAYEDGAWHQRFWYGINLGATTPGHQPGELSPSYEDYQRWLKEMSELGVEVLRVYTILPPSFYQALYDHNRSEDKNIWLMQGIWSPEEELITTQNAYLPQIQKQFHQEIKLAVRAVYGQGRIPAKRGKASGFYQANCAPYLLGWMVGSEWEPHMVNNTNQVNPAKDYFHGEYFYADSGASPFECWLAEKMELLARTEASTGWQHPISFVNWVTDDPLTHPDEPFPQEDLVTVDPMHLHASSTWLAGYFSAYHVYPYYPDSLRYQSDYQNYINAAGQIDPYEGYLAQLKEHHKGIPLIIAEFGVPSSRGMAHSGPVGRSQGMHTEKEQGEMDIAMFNAMQSVGMAGGVLFAWQDEWFKHTWNTMDLEIPAERRCMWLNRLTNEEMFGLIAVEPGSSTRIFIDGKDRDWSNLEPSHLVSVQAEAYTLKATSDEAYVYLSIKNKAPWDWKNTRVKVAFDNQPGGNQSLAQGKTPLGLGAEFLLSIDNPGQAVLEVASAYDQHSQQYGRILQMINVDPAWADDNNGIFLPWKLCLSREIYLPASQRHIPFEEVTLGKLIPGNSNPSSSEYNSLADYNVSARLIEVRIPWMMLGFTDPSTHQVWAYPQGLAAMTAIKSPGFGLQLLVADANGSPLLTSPVLKYNWSNWDTPSYHERKKQSYYLLQDYLASAPK